MDFFKKIEDDPYTDLAWNIPEQKQGSINIIGGNGQNFRTVIKTAEFLTNKYPIRDVKIVLPDALKDKLPPLDNLIFVNSTETGSFGEDSKLSDIINVADYNILIGDLSKNSITEKAVGSAVKSSEKPLLITRDSVDVIANDSVAQTLLNENLIIFGTMPQIQKIFRAAYYPKVLTLSQPLLQVAEALHKFTLSYPVSIITLCGDQILCAKNGLVQSVALNKSGFSPLMFWGGEMAAKIAAANLFNPGKTLEAAIFAIFN